MSTLRVDTLQTTSGTEFIEPNYEIDNWKLNSSFSSNDSTVTGWVSTDIYQAVTDSLLFNCTDTSLRKMKFVSLSIASGGSILGASGYNYSSVMFERKGPSQ